MDYGRNKKIHGFSKKSHNCNPCAQHSNTYPRGLKLKRERGNPSKIPPSRSPFLAVGGSADNKIWEQLQNTTLSGGVFFVCASALTGVLAGCRLPRVSAYCAIFRVGMARKWGRRTRFRQNNRYFAFFLAMEKSMWYTDAVYNSECAGGLHRCGLGAPLLRAVAGNVCTMIKTWCIGDGATSLHRTEG